MKNHTTAHTADDLLIKYVYIILLFQRKNEYSYTVGEGLLALPQTTKTWEYNDSTWSDLLTNFNGESITYDEIGNPLTIGSKSLTWTGRQLQSITDDENNISYTYNGDGLRTSKTVNGETTNYYYNGSILAGQKSGDDTLVFMYDNNSDIFGVIYNDVEYYYIKNAQNDVIAIADADGNVLVKYFYDAWGKITSITKADGSDITDLENDLSQNILNISTGESTPVLDENGNPVTEASTEVTLARINPILYRSYYYDKETEWYYLNTRYYSPDICRFINADGYIQTGQSLLDKNMFAYCLNNPVNLADSNGNFATVAAALIVIGITTIAGAVTAYIISRKTNQNFYQQAYSNSQNNNSNTRNNKSANCNKGKSNNSNNKKSSSKKSKNNSKTQNCSKGTYEYEEKLKPQEIAMNVFIGATVGLAVGGAAVMLGGAIITVGGFLTAAGGATTIFGYSTATAILTGQQAVATGAIAFNLEAMVFGPFYFVELEPIEWQNE